jgi:polyhydroxyalkanoate synthesis regulator phasin
VSEALQNYVTLVSGLTRGSMERFTKLAEEVLQASKANRELVENLFVTEVERAAGRLGFARAEEVQALRDEIADLRASLVALKAPAAATAARRAAESTKNAAKPPAAKRTPAKTTAAKTTAAKKTAARKTPAKKVAE